MNPLRGPRYCYQSKPCPPGSFCTMVLLPAALRNCGSQCQSLVKRKGTIYSKVTQVWSNSRKLLLKSQSPLKHPQTHTGLLPLLCPTRPIKGTVSPEKEIEVCGSARLLVSSSNLCSAGQFAPQSPAPAAVTASISSS